MAVYSPMPASRISAGISPPFFDTLSAEPNTVAANYLLAALVARPSPVVNVTAADARPVAGRRRNLVHLAALALDQHGPNIVAPLREPVAQFSPGRPLRLVGEGAVSAAVHSACVCVVSCGSSTLCKDLAATQARSRLRF